MDFSALSRFHSQLLPLAVQKVCNHLEWSLISTASQKYPDGSVLSSSLSITAAAWLCRMWISAQSRRVDVEEL